MRVRSCPAGLGPVAVAAAPVVARARGVARPDWRRLVPVPAGPPGLAGRLWLMTSSPVFFPEGASPGLYPGSGCIPACLREFQLARPVEDDNSATRIRGGSRNLENPG